MNINLKQQTQPHAAYTLAANPNTHAAHLAVACGAIAEALHTVDVPRAQAGSSHVR
jgi:hypothetical protein